MFGNMLLASVDATNFDITSIMTDAVNTVQGNIFSVLGIVVPVIATVVAAVAAVVFGMKWLKKLGK